MGPRFSGKVREEPQRHERKRGNTTEPRRLQFANPGQQACAGDASVHSPSSRAGEKKGSRITQELWRHCLTPPKASQIIAEDNGKELSGSE